MPHLVLQRGPTRVGLGPDAVARGPVGQVAQRVGQRVGEQVGDRAPPGQRGVRVGVQPGHQHERPLVGAGVRQGQAGFVAHGVADDEKVQVEGPRPPAQLPRAAMPGLDAVAQREQRGGVQGRRADDDGVEEVWLVEHADGCRAVETRHCRQPDAVAAGQFAHAFVLVIFISVLPICLGMLLAAVLGQAVVRGAVTFRTMLFLPQVVATVVIGLIWSWLLSEGGPINLALDAVGLGGVTRAWLGDFDTALPAVGLIGAWAATGLCMVLFIAGVQRIPKELYEAARMDGAGPWREFRAITLPGLRAEVGVALTLTVIAALRTFDLVYVTTSGGPGKETVVPGILIYTRAFREGDVGSAAAIAVVLAVILLVVAYAITQISDREST